MDDKGFYEDSEYIVRLLAKTTKFELFSQSEIAEFVKVGKIREYKSGEIVIKEGEYDCWVYLLLTGKLEVMHKGRIVGKLKRTGDLFGEMGVIDGSPRSATISAITPSLLLGFDASHIDQKLKTNEVGFCYIVYRLFSEVLAVRLRDATRENVKLRETLSKFGN